MIAVGWRAASLPGDDGAPPYRHAGRRRRPEFHEQADSIGFIPGFNDGPTWTVRAEVENVPTGAALDNRALVAGGRGVEHWIRPSHSAYRPFITAQTVRRYQQHLIVRLIAGPYRSSANIDQAHL